MIAPRLSRYGQHALYLDLDLVAAPNRAARTHLLANILRDRYPHADIIIGGGVIVLVADVREEDVIASITNAAEVVPEHASRKTHFVPIVFDGPDLEDVAKSSHLPVSEILQSLTSTVFHVELMGFLPGFGYLAPLDSRLVLPRRPAPRPRVPAGSLGIAGKFAGIYPFSSPGGWHLLGRAVNTKLFDPERAEPFLFAPSDHVRFESVDAPASISNESPRAASAQILDDQSAFVVEFAPACATIQDAGRPRQLQSGMPPSGPLDPETLARANLAVGNHAEEAALEIPLGRFSFRAKNRLVVSLDGEIIIHLEDGERFEVPENHRSVRYLAFRGGIDVPLVLDSRSTLLVARVGGFSGRPLRKGDVVGIADRNPKEMGAVFSRAHHDENIVEVIVDPGPHLPRFPREALDVLLASTFTVSNIFDRVGMRFDGPKIPRSGGDSALPVPMLRGAMQIATDGTPIVFGPDHPTTGGYPVLAVVRHSSWGKLARQRPGRAVRFVLGK